MSRTHSTKDLLHPRNKHRSPYDFEKLVAVEPDLSAFTEENKRAETSINFFDSKAVVTLNKALLKHHYGIQNWSIPENFLCPPIPGRVDYVHYVADLLGSENEGKIPIGEKVNVLDVGTGASCIYPLLGNAEYGWSFLASDSNFEALKAAKHNLKVNPQMARAIRLEVQKDTKSIFKGLVQPKDRFDVSMCNPPFHSSAKEAEKSSLRKTRNLKDRSATVAKLNFGGTSSELWCNGGEYEFIKQMIVESESLKTNFLWFTTLVSKSSNLPHFNKWLDAAQAEEVKVIEMKQGQKISRLLCWTFLPKEKRNIWVDSRWKK
jgi:23S rRNA (adenine1618-N6)-methyltransferase